ncbi:MAG TPA: hypothetical protein VMD27_13430 [Candidatus Aquilonibacter sp.]|nr:hypothetical protein [Candidatus Aquilonibacter sp.]
MKWLHYFTFVAVIFVGWWILSAFFQKDEQSLGFGCYVWVLSFVLLYLSMLLPFVAAKSRKTPKHA